MLTLIDLFLLRHSSNLLNILGVDFWSDVGPDSKVVDIMVDPLQVERVSEYLSLHGVQFEVCLVSHGGSWLSLAVICKLAFVYHFSFKVMIEDLQREIDMENEVEDISDVYGNILVFLGLC